MVMVKKMTKEEFKQKVFEKKHEKGYSDYKTDDEIWQSIEENDDIIDSALSCGVSVPRGIEHNIEDAAWNISLCI